LNHDGGECYIFQAVLSDSQDAVVYIRRSGFPKSRVPGLLVILERFASSYAEFVLRNGFYTTRAQELEYFQGVSFIPKLCTRFSAYSTGDAAVPSSHGEQSPAAVIVSFPFSDAILKRPIAPTSNRDIVHSMLSFFTLAIKVHRLEAEYAFSH